MAKYPFLSADWLEAAKGIREGADPSASATPHKVRMNLVITDVPENVGSNGDVEANMDTSSGSLEMDLGHLDSPDLTVTVDYATAKAIFVEGNPQAGMQAFMAGKIKVQGDMTKLMAMQSGAPDPAAQETAKKIAEITE